MIPELGLVVLIMALAFAVLQTGLPVILRYSRASANSTLIAQLMVLGQFSCLLLAYICLTYAFVVDDFSVVYVANHSSVELPWFYKWTAVWGGHEGSMLLWILLLALWTLAVARFSDAIPDDLRTAILAVMGCVSIGLLLFLLSSSNPFLRFLPEFPDNGRDLNPLLQDPGLIIHPPMLYLGYVGSTVPFAFAIAALITGRLERSWVNWVRPWALVAWAFLTMGIVLGSWWAYRELGWGGWWFWDPVENVSFLPWLTATALIHSLAVTAKRETFSAWSVLLAIIGFALSLFGTFIVRSGLLTSVHAFAVDPERGVFMLALLFITLTVSFGLYAWRGISQRPAEAFNLLSRETLLLLNNVLLTVAMLTVLLGTLYPLIIDALGLGKLSVGAPYFNAVFVPIMAPLLFLLGMGPHTQWRQMSASTLLKRMRFALLVSLSVGVLLPWAMTGHMSFGIALGMSLSVWIIWLTAVFAWQRYPHLNRSYWGMITAHMGMAVCVIGMTLSTYYGEERDVRLSPGDQLTINAYQLEFIDSKQITGPNYWGVEAKFLLTRGDKTIGHLTPKKKLYTIQEMAMTDSSIAVNLWRDIYVALAEPLDNDAWAVRVYYKPFVRWIWAGGLLIMLGGLMAAFHRGRSAR